MGTRSCGDGGVVRGKGAVTPEEALENVHTNLYNCVGEAVTSIVHLEKTWSQSELTKRIVRYIYNSAKSPELSTMPWKEAAKKLVERAMHGYCAACQEKPWFFEIDLAPAFSSAAWEILSARGRSRMKYAELEEVVVQEYEEILDKTLLMKAMWDSTHAVFPDRAAQTKVYNSLYRSYQPALDECIVNAKLEDLQRVEHFTKRWLDDSMRRAWCSVEQAERTITRGSVLKLFQNLIAPFGDNHPFSCIPVVLTDQIGRPPQNWPFIHKAVEQLFLTWHQESSTGSSSKKRKTRSGAVSGGEDAVMEEEATPSRSVPWQHQVGKRRLPSPEVSHDEEDPDCAGDDRDRSGHPDCTSAEDCIGRPDDRLVRHILDGMDGDIYCETCWGSFLEQNPHLEGIWEDGAEAGAPFAAAG